MSTENISWEVKRDYIHHLASKGMRPDNRRPDEYRKAEIITDFIPHSAGSALVKLGNTQVLAGVTMSVGKPYPDTPTSGTLMTNAELVPLASPLFETGPPSADSVEVARVVDRGLRESKAIDFEKLCITPGEAAWTVNVDLHVLDYDGNLFDASALAGIAALLNTRIPKYEDGKVIKEEKTGPLPVGKKPIECTFVKIGNTLLLDPNIDEEQAMDARVTIATVDGKLCAMQKGGRGSFTIKEIDDLIQMSFEKGKELSRLLQGDS